MIFTFELTEEQANKILQSLAKEPYIEVAELINILNEQAYRQRQDSQTRQQKSKGHKDNP